MKGKKNMLTTQTILEQLTGSHIVDALVKAMMVCCEDFAEDRQRYIAAMDMLRKELGEEAANEMDAIERQSASDLLFSGLLGLKANLDNFIDPVARNFLEVDSEVYLREETAHRLPEYERAQEVRNRFYALLSPSQRKIYEDVIPYTSHLETAGPKLAHYYGYILGNILLPRVVPGYHSDPVLTMQYTEMLEKHFGKSLDELVHCSVSTYRS